MNSRNFLNLNETKLFIKHPLGVRKILKSYLSRIIECPHRRFVLASLSGAKEFLKISFVKSGKPTFYCLSLIVHDLSAYLLLLLGRKMKIYGNVIIVIRDKKN